MLEKHGYSLGHLEYDVNFSQNQSITDTLVCSDMKVKLVKEIKASTSHMAIYGQTEPTKSPSSITDTLNTNKNLLDPQLFETLDKSSKKSKIDGQ